MICARLCHKYFTSVLHVCTYHHYANSKYIRINNCGTFKNEVVRRKLKAAKIFIKNYM
jgi:hypothetical protein